MHTAKLVVAVLVLALAGTAAANATPAEDAAFLLSLAQGAQQQQTQEGSLSGVGIPAPTRRSTPCSISRACGDGNTATCTGNNFCTFSTRGVTCDSTEYACPNYCTMGWSCPCPDGYLHYQCSSLRGDCGVTATGCNGIPIRCKCGVNPIYPCEEEVPPTC